MLVPELLHDCMITGIVTGILGFLGWILYFPVRTIFNKVAAEWFRATSTIDGIATELGTQRSNCLTTLQSQGNRQIELMEKSVDHLDEMRLGFAELAGYLKAKK